MYSVLTPLPTSVDRFYPLKSPLQGGEEYTKNTENGKKKKKKKRFLMKLGISWDDPKAT